MLEDTNSLDGAHFEVSGAIKDISFVNVNKHQTKFMFFITRWNLKIMISSLSYKKGLKIDI